MDENKNSKQYRLAELDLIHPKNSHDFQILLTGKNKKVLEIGTASGYITEILKKHGCKVTGIEENPDLPLPLILEILVGKEEIKSGLGTPYVFGE